MTLLFFRNPNKKSATSGGHGRYTLELNHTHYIFFDDGTCNSLDTGEFTSNLARKISYGAKRRSQYSAWHISHYCFPRICVVSNLVPLITVLVGGALSSLPSIHTDLEKQIPVVIINVIGIYMKIEVRY